MFGDVAVVGESLKLFDVGNDSVKYMWRNMFTETDSSSTHYLLHDAMYMQKRMNHLYVSYQNYGFGVYDMTDPINPVTVHEHDYGEENDYPYGIYANDDYIVVADIGINKYIRIHENGGDYAELSKFTPPDTASCGGVFQVAIKGNLLYTDAGMIYDISDPTNPLKVVDYWTHSIPNFYYISWTDCGNTNGLFNIFSNKLMWTAGGYKRLYSAPRAALLDINDYRNITVINSFNYTWPIYDMHWVDSKLYVSFGVQNEPGGLIRIYDVSAQTPPKSFDLVYPFNDTTIVLARDNFLDTLYFAWNESKDWNGDKLTYKREMTGGLPNYIRFIVETEKDSTTNMYKVPYHHSEHYMHEANVELISGTWTIIATDGNYDVSATNGPFTLTIDGSKLNVNESDLLPESFALYANYPNPFNPTTTISYDLPKRSQVTLGIYDLLGKQIRTLVNQSQDAGNKIAVWDGTDELGRTVSAGVYLYRIQAGEFSQTRKMLLLK